MSLLTLFVLCSSIKFGLAARNGLYVYNASNCTCPEQVITYECSVIGGLFTVWNGSIIAGNCTITLIHNNQFDSQNGFCATTAGSNMVTARGVRKENNCYISQMTVLFDPDLEGRTIECCVDYGPMNVTHIDTATLTLTRMPFPPPSNLQLIDANPNELTFTWTPPPQFCPSLAFNIISENCGVCENVSTQTTTTCSNYSLATVCIIKVYSVICGNLVSLFPSNIVNATLKVHDAPSIITCVPHYSFDDDKLLSIQTNFSVVEPFSISDGVDGSATNYTLSYTDDMGRSCGLATLSPSLCENDVCTHTFEVSASNCSQFTGISVTVFATNKLGDGSHTSQVLKDGINRLVKVLVMSSSSTLNFNCTFLNGPQDNAKECLATLSHGVNCENHLGVYAGSGEGNSLMITTVSALQPLDDSAKYCFAVQARSRNKTVVVEGTILRLVISGNGPITDELIAAIAVPSILLIVFVIGGIIAFVHLMNKYLKGANRPVITRFSSKQDVDTLLSILKVFKDHKINIIGFNAYCEPLQVHKKDVHLHCTQQDAVRLRQILDQDRLRGIIDHSSTKILASDGSSAGETRMTVILSLKDRLGSLWKTLNAIKDGRVKLDLEGVNTWSNQTTSDGHKDIFVSCLCPQRIHMQNISDKLQAAGARNISYEFAPATKKRVSILIRDKFSMLIHTLKIFGDLNISVVGLDEDYSRHQENVKPEERIYVVECKQANSELAEDNQTTLNSAKDKLENYGAKCCAARSTTDRDTWTFEFTVRDEIGSLAAVLQGFVALGLEIDNINRERGDPENITKQEYRHILIKCNAGRTSVAEKQFLEDLEATGYVDGPTMRENDEDSVAEISPRKLDFDIRHTPGALVAALIVLAKYDVNMTHIENHHVKLLHAYRHHYIDFISTDHQRLQLLSKLKEIGSMPKIINESTSTVSQEAETNLKIV